jgi:hypothetical protein
VLRRYIGYDRYGTRAAFTALKAVHELLRLYVNFFLPVRKLVSKSATAPGWSSGTIAPRRPTAGSWPAESSRRTPCRARRRVSAAQSTPVTRGPANPPRRALEARRREEGRHMSLVRASRRRIHARRPRARQGQEDQGRTLGDHHSEASPPTSVTRNSEATRGRSTNTCLMLEGRSVRSATGTRAAPAALMNTIALPREVYGQAGKVGR